MPTDHHPCGHQHFSCLHSTEVLDKERRKAWTETNATAKAAQKRKPGRPAKGDVVSPEKKDAKALKNLRYVLLKNPENLSANQIDQLKFLTKANHRLYRAYLLKEGLKLALKAGSDEISKALIKWMGWAQRCRIPAFRELRLKIKRHFKAFVAAATHGLSNARIEATNNKIKLIIRRAYGFRNMDNMIAMIMLSCSSVHPSLESFVLFKTAILPHTKAPRKVAGSSINTFAFLESTDIVGEDE